MRHTGTGEEILLRLALQDIRHLHGVRSIRRTTGTSSEQQARQRQQPHPRGLATPKTKRNRSGIHAGLSNFSMPSAFRITFS